MPCRMSDMPWNFSRQMHMQGKQGLSQTDKKIIGAFLITLLSIVIVASLSYFIFGQPNQTPNSSSPMPTSTPLPTSKPTPTPSSTSLTTANVVASLDYVSSWYLIINGTVTNNSPNIAYDVGLHVTAYGSPFGLKEKIIDMTVPITSDLYAQNRPPDTYPLSTLTPYQSVPIEIELRPFYQSRTPTLIDIKITLVCSNTP